ncbi:MAG: hypothetical protein H0X51_07900 [Parachlamydiaceae bacterium]|nr:hypothetical protein [Parachlamydiaceae bacterium]
MFRLFIAITAIGGLLSCSSEDTSSGFGGQHQKGEYVYRTHEESFFKIAPPQPQTPSPYPWEKGSSKNYLKITKEFFRCKGSNLNPARIVQEKDEMVRYYDCGGSDKHSLPLRGGKEFIYPIFIDLLNYIQAQTEKRVVITSGHRCPEHNSYVDPTPGNRFSKHMVGAEVSFYVQGLENQPERILKLLQEYYKKTSKYQMKKEYVDFQRYEKEDVTTAMSPWYNKEIFVKIFNKKEGRNFDNRHPYPYLSIQVRFDEDTKEKVIYTWDKANHNYLRH